MATTSTRTSVHASVPTRDRHATKIKFSTVGRVSANVALNLHVHVHKGLIRTHAPVSVHHIRALQVDNLTVSLAAVCATRGTPAQRTKCLMKGLVSVSVPGWKSVAPRSNSTQTLASASVLTTVVPVQPIRSTTNENAGVSAGGTLRVLGTMFSTTVAVTACATAGAHIRTSWTTSPVNVCVTRLAPRERSSLTAASVFP